MPKPINLVFSAGVTPEQALKRTGDAAFSLFTLDLAPFYYLRQDKVGDMTVDRWEQEGGNDTAIDLTFDPSSDVSFVSVISGDAAHARSVATKLNEFLMLLPAEEFIALALRDVVDGPALVRAAIACDEEDHAGLREAIEKRLADPRADIRGAAIKSAALVSWRSLVPSLQAAAMGEADPALCSFIAIALKKCGSKA
jgi:hypothetical protein